MLVNRRNHKAANVLASALSSSVGRQITKAAVSDLSKRVSNMFSSQTESRPGNAVRPTIAGGALRVLPPRRIKARKNRKRQRNPTIPSIYRTPSLDRIRVLLKEGFTITTGLGGVADPYYQIAIQQNTGQDMRSWLPRAATLSAAFRYFKVNQLVVSFQPSVASTATGTVVIGVDPDPNATAASTIGQVIRHEPSALGDIKDPHTIVWTPGDNAESIDKLCNTAGLTTAPSTISDGVIQLYTSATSILSGAIGVLIVQADIEFYGLQ
jgi:hypothetical protein